MPLELVLKLKTGVCPINYIVNSELDLSNYFNNLAHLKNNKLRVKWTIIHILLLPVPSHN